ASALTDGAASEAGHPPADSERSVRSTFHGRHRHGERPWTDDHGQDKHLPGAPVDVELAAIADVPTAVSPHVTELHGSARAPGGAQPSRLYGAARDEKHELPAPEVRAAAEPEQGHGVVPPLQVPSRSRMMEAGAPVDGGTRVRPASRAHPPRSGAALIAPGGQDEPSMASREPVVMAAVLRAQPIMRRVGANKAVGDTHQRRSREVAPRPHTAVPKVRTAGPQREAASASESGQHVSQGVRHAVSDALRKVSDWQVVSRLSSKSRATVRAIPVQGATKVSRVADSRPPALQNVGAIEARERVELGVRTAVHLAGRGAGVVDAAADTVPDPEPSIYLTTARHHARGQKSGSSRSPTAPGIARGARGFTARSLHKPLRSVMRKLAVHERSDRAQGNGTEAQTAATAPAPTALVSDGAFASAVRFAAAGGEQHARLATAAEAPNTASAGVPQMPAAIRSFVFAPRFAQDVAAVVTASMGAGASATALELTLVPASLGRVRVQLVTSSKGDLHVHLLCDGEQARSLAAQGADQLAAALGGLAFASVSVDVSGHGAQDEGSGAQRPAQSLDYGELPVAHAAVGRVDSSPLYPDGFYARA
ncbi:MAG: flagellar hook-length control protein FliK, partial [Firmicutes bacterium]|nr:flagellar hook-length control protein FliK [Bacillota bacterium]